MKIEGLRNGLMNMPTLEKAKALAARIAPEPPPNPWGGKFYMPDKNDMREAATEKALYNEARAIINEREEVELALRGINVPWELHMLLSGMTDEQQARDREPAVDGRKLWQALDTGARFRDWFPQRVEDCDLIGGEDFREISREIQEGRGRPEKNYLVSLDAARQMAMATHSPAASQARKWFSWRIRELDRIREKLARDAAERSREEARWAEHRGRKQAALSLADALDIFPEQALRRIERDQLGATHYSADIKWQPGGIYGRPGCRSEAERKEEGKRRQEAWERQGG